MAERHINHHEIPGVTPDVADKIAEIAFKDNVLINTMRGNEDGATKQAAAQMFRNNTQEVKDLRTPEHPIGAPEALGLVHKLRFTLERSDRLTDSAKGADVQAWSFWKTGAQILANVEKVLGGTDSIAVAKSELARKIVSGVNSSVQDPVDPKRRYIVEDSLYRKAQLPIGAQTRTEFSGLGLSAGDRIKTGIIGDRTDTAGHLDRELYMAVTSLDILEILEAQPKTARQLLEEKSTPILTNAVDTLFNRPIILPKEDALRSLVLPRP